MLCNFCSAELGHKDFQFPITKTPHSSRKSQNPQFNSTSRVSISTHTTRVFRGFLIQSKCRTTEFFNSVNYPCLYFESESGFDKKLGSCNAIRNPRSGARVSLGFRVGFRLQAVVSPTRSSGNGRKRKYGGALPSILRALERSDDVDGVLGSFVGELNPKEQTVILKEQRDWARVLRIFRWMKSREEYDPNVIHYNVVLRALGRAQKWDELRLCWIEMAKDRVFPTNNTYGMLVDVYAKSGLVKEALLWIKQMKQRGVFPDEVTMNTVVRVLKDVGEFDKAERFFKDWCKGRVELDDLDFESVADPKSGLGPLSVKHFLSTELFKAGGRMPPLKLMGSSLEVEPSIRKPRMTATYNTLIDLYGKAGRLKDASNAFAEMLKAGVAPDTITFNTMIFTCGTNGLLSEAESLLQKMEERRVLPDTKTYNIFLSLYADAGNMDAALMCYKKIREVGLFPDDVTHRAVIHVLCEKHMISEVEAIIEEMDNLSICVDENSIPTIIRMYVDTGLLDKAKNFFEKCQPRSRISSKTYAAILDAYAEKGVWADAEEIFFGNRSKLTNKDVIEYNVMLKAYGQAKLYDKALSLFKSMRSNGTWPDECTYNSLIQMLSGGDVVDTAKDLLSEMQEAGFKPRCSTFSAVIASHIRLGRVFDAVDIYKEMKRVGVEPNEVVYGSLINGFAEAERLEEALHYFHTMEDVGIPANQIILTSLIKAYGKVGCLEEAQRLYGKMKGMDGGPDVVASNSMIDLYADLGIVSEAELIFNKLRENGQADGFSFANMMYLYKSMGMLDKAIDVAQEMQESGLLRDCTSFNRVLASYARNGQLVECGELLHQMVTRKLLPDDGTFKVLFTIMKKVDIPSEALAQLESSYHAEKPFAREAVITCVFSAVGLHAFALESCEVVKAKAGLDNFVYNVAIYAYRLSGKVDEALNMFMKMQNEGLKPDLVTYINLVHCYGKARIVAGIKRIYGQIMCGDIEPHETLFKAVIDAYKECKRGDLASLVEQEMRFTFDERENSGSETEGEELLGYGTEEELDPEIYENPLEASEASESDQLVFSD
ncbi:hypothetical protein Sjap_025554 [Stephania japonica]|uniref:PROP1-like PPR domain-containing protein n=1 Tax=Stephania japonica TaxID=461633 RepID=A0AAP0E527_9MAGN